MMTKKEILKAARKTKEITSGLCFVYFLIDKDEVIYVGGTRRGFVRLFVHIDLATRPNKYTRYKKEFDSFHYIPCKANELADLEAEYIIQLDPKCNVSIPKNNKYVPFYLIRREYNLTSETLQFLIRKYHIPVYRKQHIELSLFKIALKDYQKGRKNN